jgi:predicted  nucleic acid-binding Zn-ribbon protein
MKNNYSHIAKEIDMTDNLSSSTGTSTEESPQEFYARLVSEWSSLSSKVTLNDVSQSLGSVDGELAELDDQIKDLRQRGYIFDGDWEQKAADLHSGWPQQQRSARRELDQQSQLLRETAAEIERLVNRAERDHNRLDDLERNLSSFESQVSAAAQSVEQAFQRTSDGLGEIYEAMEWATFMLDHLHEAPFKLFPDENGVAACKAKWLSKKGEPEGLLYLTDQRLIYETVEEVATKKVLFVTTEKETVRELAWEAPVGAVDKVSAEDKGGFVGIGVKELLTLNFNRDAKDVPDEVTMRFLDYADNEMWQGLVERVKSGQIEQEKYAGSEEEVASEAVSAPAASAPTTCSSCGGKMPTVFKGMQRIECEFCGNVIHLE